MIIVKTIGDCERRFSDLGVKLLQRETDTIWDDAVDIIPCEFTYVETDIPVDDPEIDDVDLLDILMGVTE